MCVILTLTLANVKSKNTNRKAVCDFRFICNSNVCSIYHRFRDNRNRNVHGLDQGQGRAKVKYKYKNRMAICDFILVVNSTCCHICHHFQDIQHRHVHDLDFDL